MMNPRSAPLSPVSVGAPSEFTPSAYNEPGYNGGLISPPASRSSKGGSYNMNGFPPVPGPRSNGAPSPPASVSGRSSHAYRNSESGQSIRGEATEAVLGEHYIALRRFLASTSKDGRANPPPNKARDKLLRLSSVQFLELSTDVFDELIRRQAVGRRPPNAPPNVGPPPYLTPETNFHPKRNQARQKLSTLGPPRFRDLATDVFCELERRIPRFAAGDVQRMGSPASRGSRGPGNSVNGYRGPPPPGARMRRPSDASSIRSGMGPPTPNGYPGVPPSPSLPNGGAFPQAKAFQSNTIVPNKSTMVEEDDDGAGSEDNDAFGLDRVGRDSKRSAGSSSDTDKKLIEDYQLQLQELRDKLDMMEDQMKKKDDDMNSAVDEERSRAKADMESKLAEINDANESMRVEMDRLREDHVMETRRLQDEIAAGAAVAGSRAGDDDLVRENEDLRMSLQEQQRITDEARHEARQFLQEMKALTQQHKPDWDRQSELEKTVERLELEVRDWKNRYARTKTQLRHMRGSSTGLNMEQDAARHVREGGFTEDGGLVKDVHVTKFQLSIEELLQRARHDEPAKIIDYMKTVVMSVRRITNDVAGAQPADEAMRHQVQKLKTRVSATANNLITASKNFASAAGISPVSLLDAAASHLVAAVVELCRVVKVRATPAGELEDEDDGSVTPVESAGFFSNRTTTTQQDGYGRNQDPLAPPPTFDGLRVGHQSTQSSAYSSSPRGSMDPYAQNNGMVGAGGMANPGSNTNLATAPNGHGQQDFRTADLKIFLQNHSDILVSTIQGLVGLIRSEGQIQELTAEISSIAQVVGMIVGETEASGHGSDILDRLSSCRERLLEASDHGQDLAAKGLGNEDREWRMWAQTLPPIAFETARETKELVQQIDRLFISPAEDDFS